MAASRMAPVTAVTGTFGDLLDALDLGVDRQSAVAELEALVAVPWDDRRGDPRLRSALTESGAPFEVSVKLGRQGAVALRYVVDTADHRYGLVANRDRYLRHACLTTGAPDATLGALLDCHLQRPGPSAAPRVPPARVMHGVEHAPGRRRASLYFPTSWWAPVELHDRVAALPGVPPPDCQDAHLLPGVSEQIEVVGYDFVDGQVGAAKSYRWLAVTDDAAFAAAAAHPHLEAATLLYRAFAGGVHAAARDRSGFLQLAGSEPVPKLFFFAHAWGWSTREGLGGLLRFLAGDLEIDLRPLLALRAAADAYDLSLTVGMVALGGSASDPTVTCYLWPALTGGER